MKVSKFSFISKSAIIFLLIVGGFISAQNNDIRNADPIGFPNIKKESTTDKNKIQKIYGNSLKSNSASSGISIKPLFIVNGEKIENLNEINSEKIKSMTVYKDQKAIELYGEEPKNGVIVIEAQKDFFLKGKPVKKEKPIKPVLIPL